MNARRTSGYTLLELLTVLMVLALVLALSITGLQRLNRTAQLRALATQFAADLNHLRSAATTRNVTGQLTLNATGTAYTVQAGTQAARTVTLPAGFIARGVQDAGGSWTPTSTATWSIAYSAPYGEVQAVPNAFEFRASANDLNPRVVRVVGITGKVINGD